MSINKKNEKGDDDCIHCYGVAYFNDQMKAAGKQPTCFGYLCHEMNFHFLNSMSEFSNEVQ
jgi:hypothetical protein